MPLAALQFPLYRNPNELGAVFAVLKNGVDAIKRAVREACRSLLVVDLLPTHAPKIDDITNCYKPYFGLASLWIDDIIYASEREMDMATIKAIRAVRGATGEARYFETLAAAHKFCRERGDHNELWRVE